MSKPTFDDLVRLMARLRAPGGCVWDRAQTHESLRPYLLEETYEALDAIGDPARLCDELGDVLLQVVFHAQIAAEAGHFTLDDVIAALHDKLIRRHPHVFGPGAGAPGPDTPQAVKDRWDELKRLERAEPDSRAGNGAAAALDEVLPSLPALMWSQKTQRRAAAAGVGGIGLEAALAQLDEELTELRTSAARIDTRSIHEEVGDTLMAVVKVAALAGADAEQALRDAVARFRRRFAAMERVAAARGRSFGEMTHAEREALWRDAKNSPR